MNIYSTIKALEVIADGHIDKLCPTKNPIRFPGQYPQQLKFYRCKNQELASESYLMFAKIYNQFIVLNLFERDGNRTYDTSPVIDIDGCILGKTRMVHITEYMHFHEQGYYHPGDTGAPVYDTTFGKIGVALTAVASGFLIDNFGWNAVFNFWILAPICLIY